MSATTSDFARTPDFFDELRPGAVETPNAQRVAVAPTVNAAAARIARQEELAAGLGFAPEDLYFTVGTELDAVGRDAYQTSRRDYDALPSFADAAGSLGAAVVAEHRSDRVVPVPALYLDASGALGRRNADAAASALPMTGGAFRQLTQRLDMPRAAAYLSACPPDLRAANVNRWQDYKAERLADRRVKVRLRKRAGKPEVFAVLGEHYTSFDADRLAQLTAQAMPAAAKGEVLYDGSNSMLRALWHAPEAFGNEAAVGDHYKVACEVRSSDVGLGSIQVRMLLYQVKCRNFTTAVRAKSLLTQSHKGSDREIVRALRKSLAAGLGMLKGFFGDWQRADLESVIAGTLHHGDVEPVFAALLKAKMIDVSGVDDETMVRRLRAAYWQSPSPTVKGVVDAVTRAAHESSWCSPWVAGELQDQAGDLVRQYVRVASLGRDATLAAAAGGWQPNTLETVSNGALQGAVFTL